MTMNRVLMIGGPAEGRVVHSTGKDIVVPELAPVTFKEYTDAFDMLNDPVPSYTTHVYRIQKLAYKEQDGREYFKEVYLHSSLNPEDGFNRLKDFLLKQFILMEL